MTGDTFTLSMLIIAIITALGSIAYFVGYLKIKYLVIVGAVLASVFLAIVIPTMIPQDPIERLYEKAETAVDSGKFDAAIAYYSQIIKKMPNEEKAWHEKGKLLNRFEKCDEAVDHYEKYVANFPDSSRGQEGYEIAISQCM